MKAIKIIVLSMLCALAFSSCQKNYQKLIIGKWSIDAKASYFVDNDKRKYFDEYPNDKYMMEFFDNGQVEVTIGTEKKKGLYHFDGDYYYVEGESIHIVKMNNKRMIIESNESDSDDFVHFEFDRTDYDFLKMFFLNIKCSFPFWIRIVLMVCTILFMLLLYCLAYEVDDTSWVVKVLFWLLVIGIGYEALFGDGLLGIFFFL